MSSVADTRLVSVSLAGVALLAAVLLGCSAEAERSDSTGATPPAVETTPATARTTPLPILTSGRLASQAEVQLAFKVGGIIERLRVDEGDRVQAGQRLGRLDLSEIDAQVQEAKSALEKARRDRDRTRRFGGASYAMEELVAELGAAFLCAELGISAQPREDHAGYIAHWLEVMREDAAAIFTAAAKASEAAKYLKGTADEERA